MEKHVTKQSLSKDKNHSEKLNSECKKEKDKEETNDKIDWEYIQGYPNPYGKEFYDYVKQHKNIKFSKNPKTARIEMRELAYKIHACPTEKDLPTTLCEKSLGRLLIEFLLDLPDIL